MKSKRKAKFYPIEAPDQKPNCKIFHRIERDGTIVERAFLDVSEPSERERLICSHYLTHIVRCFIRDDVGVNILSRDKPWDFQIQLSTGSAFGLEITSIADGPQHFEINKREERLAAWKIVEKIPLRELEKLNMFFPDTRVGKLIEEHKIRKIGRDELIDNPLMTTKPNIIVSWLPEPVKSLEEQIRTAIEKKLAKSHPYKDNTVLIIDNRTSAYDVPDYITAAEALRSFVMSTPFPEIWFYTGYYSDNHGNHAEFSFAPLKVTDEQAEGLRRMSIGGELPNNCRLIR